MRREEINGFLLEEKEIRIKDDGRRLMPLDDEDKSVPPSTVWVQMAPPSEKAVTKLFVTVGEETVPLGGFTFEKACEWARECPQDLANILFD